MTKPNTTTIKLTFAALFVGACIASTAAAQSPYTDPYQQRDARHAYLASQRAKAAVPVNYTFPVRRDLATAYNAAAYSPQYQYSQYGSPYAAYPNARSYSGYQNPQQTTYRPYNTPYAGYANSYPTIPYAASPAVANPYQSARPICSGSSSSATTDAYYRATGSTGANPYYVGSTLAGPPKVYPRSEPIRNVFRYLFP